MSEAKLQVMEMLRQVPDTVADEFQVVDDLYKLLKLQKSQEAVRRGETMTTSEVREYFDERRRRTAVK